MRARPVGGRIIAPMPVVTSDLAVLIQRGGIVMVPLLVLSIISLTLIIERAWFWTTLHGPGRPRRLGRVNAAFRAGDPAQIKRALPPTRSVYGQVAQQLMQHGASDAVAIEAVETQRPRIDRFMATLSTIITAAPLLGILGTVIGIIQSFNLLGVQETLTDPRAVSTGIAEALLTTAMGLVVAIFTLFPYMVFRAHAQRSIGRMESLIAAAQQGAGVVAAAGRPAAQTTAAVTAEAMTAKRTAVSGRIG